MSLPLPEQTSRNRSASTGDSGLPTHDNKRPRLSESQDNNQNNPDVSTSDANKSTTSQVLTSSKAVDPATSALVSPPQSPLPSSQPLEPTSPRSKFTINTRPISSQSPTMDAPSDVSNGVAKPDVTPVTVELTSKDSTSINSNQHETISISSDDDGSPVIQVAVPEDLDQDPADTHWEPISDKHLARRLSIQSGHVRRTFPYANQSSQTQLSNIVSRIAQIFSDGNGNEEGEIFRQVKTWTVEFANNAIALDYAFFAEDREFWLKFPHLVSGLLRRRTDLSISIDVNDVVDFFVAFARICQLLVEADVTKLQSYTETPDTGTIASTLCNSFLSSVQWTMHAEDIPFYDILHEVHNYDPVVITGLIIDQILDSFGVKHITSLHRLFKAMTPLYAKRPALLDASLAVVVHCGTIVNLFSNRHNSLATDILGSDASLHEVLVASLGFYKSVNETLDRAITKQQPWLNIETCDKVFKAISPFVGSLAAHHPGLANDLVRAANIRTSKFDDAELTSLASYAWKLSTALKFIKKGRMEVRVASVQIMAQDLVQVYNDLIRTSYKSSEHPTVQFMIDFIRENDIIRYIIGVDSHPQIIDRSANIIGFLCVSRNYHNEDTDLIWQTVVESQDPRTVVALIGIFQHNLENLEVEILTHLVQKLNELPIERFDTYILDFANRLITVVNGKARDLNEIEEVARLNECVIEICLKVLREINSPDRICTEIANRTRGQFSQALKNQVHYMRGRLSLGDGNDYMHSVFLRLCTDVRSHNNFANGSILALGALLQDAEGSECLRIAKDYDLATLLMDDIVFACKNSLKGPPKEFVWFEFDSRFSLLLTLVYRVSSAIDQSFLQGLWSNVLANSSLEPRLRSQAWLTLANIFDSCRVRNTVLDMIVEDFLPGLSPQLYDDAVLQFAQQSVKYEMRHMPIDLMEPQQTVIIPGIERVWNIMLTAAPNTIEVDASKFVIEQYLEGERISQQDSLVVEATHLGLVDRSVQLVIETASHLTSNVDTSMTDLNLTSTNSSTSSTLLEREHHALKFHRSLLFLRKFLNCLKTKTRYTPAITDNLKKTLSSFEKKGDVFEVTLQVIGHKSIANGQMKWLLGKANSGAEVWQFLSDVTGWTQFTMIHQGRKITLKDEKTDLVQLGVKTGSIMINKVQGSPENAPLRAVRASSPVDNKVMHHFDDLYNLLELDDQFAKEVYDFLRMFSSQEEVVQRLKAMSTAPRELLPVSKPFKLMYYARALRSCIEDESFSSEPNTDFLVYGINTILSVLPSLHQLKTELTTRISIAHGLTEALILGFRARVSTEVSSQYISDHALFSQNLLSLWSQALQVSLTSPDVSVTATQLRAPFEALIEGTLHDDTVWTTLAVEDLQLCLAKTLLSHPALDVRQAMLDVIHGLTGVMNIKVLAKSNESRAPRTRFSSARIESCLGHLWQVLLSMMEQAASNAVTCEEYFDCLIAVFRKCRASLDEDDINIEVNRWRSLLLDHRYSQQVGIAPKDFYVSSMGRLLLQGVKALPQASIAGGKSFVQDLFSSFLFPPLTQSDSTNLATDSETKQQRDPVLDMHTRWVLYELCLALTVDNNTIDVVCNKLNDDLLSKEIYFQPTTNNDRQAVRSEVGYSGLRNLSNTCYLNSLISQLFMNVQFRELVMNVNIIDQNKQRLVAELGKVFAYMQMSYEEAVSPESAINAITLWDGDQIDVTVQMDVDEFFNLLFDRLESQIIDPKVCGAFKGIYGGQLVQQIKSKECEHVSERLEPFAAVQVEIKGKATLEESLRAYVEGEVLQGENKYSCTGCGKHVDAVKRACLKTIPDHLIFNLKRFDYDIMTGMRCKVNDEFGFPDLVDMTPYTLEAITNPDTITKPDFFELVGIIIHSGTAESGHYYSYVRQRPSSMTKDRSWVQFNDHDVTQFDPSSIRECCFGGIDNGTIPCPKFYNGYMLFYQRSSSIHNFERKYSDTTLATPVRLPVATELGTNIAQQNEMFLRSYVAQDPIHAKFVRLLLQQKQLNESLQCHPKHQDVVSKLLLVVLNYMNQLSARWKEIPDVEECLSLLRQYAADCESCAQTILLWIVEDDNLADNLVRSCYAAVRKGFMSLIATCCTKWSVATSSDRNGSDQDDFLSFVQAYFDCVKKLLSKMSDAWDHLQRYGRSWEQYFGLLQLILQSGEHEARMIVETGFLGSALEIVSVHVPSMTISKRLRSKYSTYLLQRERNRPFAHTLLIQFFTELLPHIDLTIPVTDFQDRLTFEDRAGPSRSEAMMLGILEAVPNVAWLKKIICGRHNPPAVNKITRYLCEIKLFDQSMCGLLKDGLGERNLVFATAFLQPTLTFASSCSSMDLVEEVVEEALTLIETTNGQYSKEFLNFVQEVLQLSNMSIPFAQGTLRPMVKKQIPHWAPVLLMAPNDIHADVRNEAADIVNVLLFRNMDELRVDDHRQYRMDVNTCRNLAFSCATFAESTFINARTPMIHPGQAAQVSQVVDHCMVYFGETASEEEAAAKINNVIEDFEARANGLVESITEADWNASSDFEAMSEVDNMSDTSN